MTTAAPAEVVIPAAPIAEVQEEAAPIAEAREAVTPAAVTVEAPEETVAATAEVTWIWSGHRICCSPAHAIDIYILRIP